MTGFCTEQIYEMRKERYAMIYMVSAHTAINNKLILFDTQHENFEISETGVKLLDFVKAKDPSFGKTFCKHNPPIMFCNPNLSLYGGVLSYGNTLTPLRRDPSI